MNQNKNKVQNCKGNNTVTFNSSFKRVLFFGKLNSNLNLRQYGETQFEEVNVGNSIFIDSEYGIHPTDDGS